ncbi:hypothetical protein BHM03_00032808 [Ensete ventricosum]|nr:hypothetical protein BHM03_00032808 [Ensete ventricosum]
MEDGRLLLLKLGVALAVPLAGYLVSHLNFQTSADTGLRLRLCFYAGSTQLTVDAESSSNHFLFFCVLLVVENDESATGRRSIHAAPIGCGKRPQRWAPHSTKLTNDFTEQSPENLVDEDGLLLQEVKQEPERAGPRNFTSNEFEGKKVKTDAEIMYLRNLVQSLWDRIRSLEIQMLEYYGSKEQHVAIRELEGELKSASEYRKIAPELESARMKTKHLKRRMRSVHLQAREEIAFLEQKIRKLNDVEHEDSQKDVDLQNKLKRLKELEDEAAELGKENSILSQENMELVQRLAYAETSISTLEKLQVVHNFSSDTQVRRSFEEVSQFTGIEATVGFLQLQLMAPPLF